MRLGFVLDLLAIVAGAGLTVAGISYWSAPAAMIVGGLALIGVGLVPVHRLWRR